MTNPHDPTVLPTDIPAPQDDGAARHLSGLTLPSLALAATDGNAVDLSNLKGRTVVYIYPRTGVPGQPLPEGWDAIPGARGCTPQSCSFRDHFDELKGSASRTFTACRRRTPTTSARRRRGCNCRSRCCPTRPHALTRALNCRLSRSPA